MHELALTQSIVEAIVERTGDAEVVAVRLVIGQVSGVDPEAVRFCFGLVAEGTPVSGARLRIEEPVGRGRCRGCGTEFEAAHVVMVCRCGGADVEVLGGDELLVRSVEVV